LKLNAAYAEGWMFLNTTYQDFCYRPEAIDPNTSSPMGVTLTPETPFSDKLQPSESEPEDELHENNNDDNKTVQERNFNANFWLDSNWATTELPTRFVSPCNPSPPGLGSNKMFLLDYFINDLIPRCTTWPVENPFIRVILPICLSAINEPLFYNIMAISSYQLYMLKDKRFAMPTLYFYIL
jgi:hypothetical protein